MTEVDHRWDANDDEDAWNKIQCYRSWGRQWNLSLQFGLWIIAMTLWSATHPSEHKGIKPFGLPQMNFFTRSSSLIYLALCGRAGQTRLNIAVRSLTWTKPCGSCLKEGKRLWLGSVASDSGPRIPKHHKTFQSCVLKAWDQPDRMSSSTPILCKAYLQVMQSVAEWRTHS